MESRTLIPPVIGKQAAILLNGTGNHPPAVETKPPHKKVQMALDSRELILTDKQLINSGQV